MKNKSTEQITALLVAFIAMNTITVSLAEPPGHDPLTHMDQDKNAAVSLQELRRHRPDTTDKQFRRWDVDGNGQLEQEELMSAIREILANEAAAADR